jgi:hypothetical protein
MHGDKGSSFGSAVSYVELIVLDMEIAVDRTDSDGLDG